MKNLVSKRSRSTTPPESNGKSEHTESRGDKNAKSESEYHVNQNVTTQSNEESKKERNSTTIKVTEVPVSNSSPAKNEIGKSSSSGSLNSTSSNSSNHSSANFEEKLKRPDLKGFFLLFLFLSFSLNQS